MMTVFVSPTLLEEKEESLYKTLNKHKFFTSLVFHEVWRKYLIIAQNRNRVIGKPFLHLDDMSVNVMGIRNNQEIAFNDEQYCNDLLIIEQTQNKAHLFYVFKVTMDPKAKRSKIAHLLEGVFASYKVRPHRWQPGRTAICQGPNDVLIARTDTDGNIIKTYSKQKGIFGINIHNAAGYRNSSLGCTVLEPDSEKNDWHWKNHFKLLVKSISNKELIDYVVINKDVAIQLARSIQQRQLISMSFLDRIMFRAPWLPRNTEGVLKNV
jgi:hypothetical protein